MASTTNGADAIGTRISRRTFLAGASAAALLTAALPSAAAASATRSLARGGGGGKTAPLSVGYVDGSDVYPDLSGVPWLSPSVLELGRSVPASGAPVGDDRFVGQLARLTVHGPYPFDLPAGEVDLDAAFLAIDPTKPPVYYSWTARSTGAAARSNPVSFGVGVVSADPCLSLSVRLIPPDGSATTQTATLGVGRGKGLMKLRRGAYLLALGTGTWDSPTTLPELGDPSWAGLTSIIVTIEF
jgi:hypothetical protein